jgi:branched-chain amino acid transport system permease protein
MPNAAIFSLVAVGFVVIFRSARVFNFAQGQFMLLGAYVAYTLVQTYGLPFYIGILASFVVMFALGAAFYFGVLKRLVGEALWVPVMVTIGLSVILDSVMHILWPGELYQLGVPFHRVRVDLPAGQFTTNYDLITVAIAVVFFAALFVFYRFVRTGVEMRATAENPRLASYAGVNVDKLFALAWAISALAAAVAGVTAGGRVLITPNISALGLRAFPAALVGGLDSIPGALVGGLIIAIAETAAITYWGGQTADLAVFGSLLIVLMIRPNGIFGTQEVERV